MLKLNLIDITGKNAGTIGLPKEIFAVKVNPELMAQAVRVYLANQRTAGAKTKTRAEVNRTKAKWYRQKGTGKARHGSRAANIFVGGGIAHGPTGGQTYKLKMSQKAKKAALFSALTDKLKNKKILVIEGLEKVKPKTKEMAKTLEKLQPKADRPRAEKILIVMPKVIDNVIRAARNIEGVSLEQANLLNTYEVLNNKEIIFMKEGIDKLKETFLGKK